MDTYENDYDITQLDLDRSPAEIEKTERAYVSRKVDEHKRRIKLIGSLWTGFSVVSMLLIISLSSFGGFTIRTMMAGTVMVVGWIVLTVIAYRVRSRRYESIGEVSVDLQRYRYLETVYSSRFIVLRNKFFAENSDFQKMRGMLAQLITESTASLRSVSSRETQGGKGRLGKVFLAQGHENLLKGAKKLVAARDYLDEWSTKTNTIFYELEETFEDIAALRIAAEGGTSGEVMSALAEDLTEKTVVAFLTRQEECRRLMSLLAQLPDLDSVEDVKAYLKQSEAAEPDSGEAQLH